ncbi:MAG TPA: hypothetical protein VG939_05015 [Caulobacteraceae bacterium]|nr:hypothetical protein [Caulobacteraceae bacterium]
MHPADWIALAGAAITLVLNAAGYLVAWGMMKGTVAGMATRVAALEAEAQGYASAIADLRNGFTRVETAQTFMIETLKDLNASIRWMRDPAPFEPRGPAK